MNEEYEEFTALQKDVMVQEFHLRDIAVRLKEEAGWTTWEALAGARIMAPAAAALSAAVEQVERRYPPKPREFPCTCSACTGSLVPGTKVILGVGLGVVLSVLMSNMLDAGNEQDGPKQDR